jgi:hypothetical protein
MSLAELLSVIADVVISSDQAARDMRWIRATDLEPFLQRFRSVSADSGVTPCGEDCFSLDDAVLIYEVHPLVTPEGTPLAEAAVHQLETNGVTVHRVWHPHERVLAYTGSSREGAIEGRVLPARGWVFLLTGEPRSAIERLRDLLDDTIVEFEGAG